MEKKQFKGTQGKWKYCENWDDDSIEIGTCDIHNIALVNKEHEEAKANAQLIAAAPELLEELQHTVKALEVVASFGATKPIIERAKQVINKALGI